MKFSTHKLKDLCSKIGSGKTPLGGGSAYKDHGIPLIRSQNVLHGRFSINGLAFIDESQAHELRNVTVQNDDVLINITGDSTARVCKAPKGFLPAHVNQHVAILRPMPEKIDSNYLFYSLFSKENQDKLLGLASSGATRLAITKDMLDNFQLKLPVLDYQRKAGSILKSFDAKIENNLKVNSELEKIAQTIFKSWFVDFDPVHAKKLSLEAGLTKEQAERGAMAIIAGVCSPSEFAENFKEMDERLSQKLSKMDKDKQEELRSLVSLFPSEFEESELGEIPKGWWIESLDANINFLNGLALQKYPPKGDKTDLPILKIAQLQKGVAIGGGFASCEVPEKYKIDNGDLIFSWSASLMVRIWSGGKAALNQHLFKVSSEIYPPWYQWLWCDHHLSQFQSIAKSKATTMGHIQRKHLTDAKIIIPEKNIFQRFNIFFSPLSLQMINLELEGRVLEQLRDTLLPKFLAGEIDLSKVEIEEENL